MKIVLGLMDQIQRWLMTKELLVLPISVMNYQFLYIHYSGLIANKKKYKFVMINIIKPQTLLKHFY